MAEKLAHRGPDDAGVWIDAESGVALGHRRLTVVDLSSAENGGDKLYQRALIRTHGPSWRIEAPMTPAFGLMLKVASRWGIVG